MVERGGGENRNGEALSITDIYNEGRIQSLVFSTAASGCINMEVEGKPGFPIIMGRKDWRVRNFLGEKGGKGLPLSGFSWSNGG